MNISSAKSPYLLQIERSNRPKATYGNRFRIALKEEKAESQVTETAEEEEAVSQYKDEEAEAVSKINEAEEEEEDNGLPCYTIKDEEAEYFLEKYGEKYNDSEPFKLFDELASKNIISQDDACAASRKNSGCTVEGFPPPDIIDKLLAANGGHYTFYNLKFNFNKSDYTNNGSSTYDEFRRSKNTPINTWQDYVQDNYDYYQYLMGNYTTLRNFAGEPYMTDIEEVFSSRCAAAERVQNVLSQIFGEVTL